jgi:hypothetical protein
VQDILRFLQLMIDDLDAAGIFLGATQGFPSKRHRFQRSIEEHEDQLTRTGSQHCVRPVGLNVTVGDHGLIQEASSLRSGEATISSAIFFKESRDG